MVTFVCVVTTKVTDWAGLNRPALFLNFYRTTVNYYIRNGFIYIQIDDYFGFPHVIQDMDLTIVIEIPYSEFELYLNNESVLRK